MNLPIPKISLFLILAIAFCISEAYAVNRNNVTTGMFYTRSIGFDLEIQRKSDNKVSSLTDSFNGATFFYEHKMTTNLNWNFMVGLMNRYYNDQLFSEDLRNTDISEQILLGQLGISTSLRKVWNFYPFASVNLTYYSIETSIKNSITNSTLADSVDNDASSTPYIDETINTSVGHVTFTFGLDYSFRYSGMKFFLQNIPHYFNIGKELNSSYNYRYKLEGYLIGIGFVAYI